MSCPPPLGKIFLDDIEISNFEEIAMNTEKNPNETSCKHEFRIEGKVRLEEADCQPGTIKLAVYAFDKLGSLTGTEAVDEDGGFSVKLKISRPMDVDLVIGPPDDPRQIRQSSAYQQTFSAKDWRGESGVFRLRADIALARDIWWPWRPVRICVSGHVRKIQQIEGQNNICPVPFVKVEIFDVDREFCWWPWLRKWWDVLLDRPVIRIPDLLQERPIPKPFPEPDPAPDLSFSNVGPGVAVSLNPQPLPPRAAASLRPNPGEAVRFDPQPDPLAVSTFATQAAFSRVGEVSRLSSALASRLDKLTLTSKVAPWLIFPHCFYSKQLVCETNTDCNGYFRCCFKWYPFHFRFGRLRFDSRPDIIIRVTQIINGVETVIYMDPYTSTRWNVNNAHIDLYLDNEEVRCGQGCQPELEGSPVFFTRIGNDEVYQIDQTSGLYHDSSYTQMAYGGNLLVFAQFGDALSTGAPARYYRLSYKKQSSPDTDFKYIDADLTDTRVDKATLFATDYPLGPKPIGTTTTLYEVRNRNDYYWYNPDWIGSWWTPPVEDDTNTYILRLEMFDENGVYLNTASGQVDYRDGTVVPPAVLPAMIDHCDLVITLDNKPAIVNLGIPAVLNECGVIPWSPALTLDFNVSATQENGRLTSWALQYTKGVNPAVTVLASDSSNSGSLSPVSTTVSGAPLLAGLTSTCAFALKLYAWAHIRNGYGLIYYTEQIKAIAIERCS